MSSSPCTRRYPHPGLSLTSRSTKTWMERTVGGRPRRSGRDRAACRCLIRSRCQRSTVSGRTSSRIRRSVSGLSRCSSAASSARSGRGEPDLPLAQLAFQNRDLMPQSEDLDGFGPIAHRKKTQDREGVRHRQVGQSQQHSLSSFRDDHPAVAVPAPYQSDETQPFRVTGCHGSHLHGRNFRHAQGRVGGRTLLADRGYDHDKYRRLLRQRGIRPMIAERGRPHGTGLGIFRYVVERTIAWLHGFRRLRIRWERRDDIHEAFLGLATCLITHRHVKRLC
jgi:transposase